MAHSVHVAERVGIGVRRNHAEVETGLLQQLPYLELGLGVGALSEVGVADVAVLVYEVFGRPVPVFEGVPGPEVVVLEDRVLKAELFDGVDHVLPDLLELELRSVYPQDDETLICVLCVPLLDVGQGADAVDAGVGPEVDENDLSPLALEGEGLRVYPAIDSRELGRLPVELGALTDILGRCGRRLRRAVGAGVAVGGGSLSMEADVGSAVADGGRESTSAAFSSLPQAAAANRISRAKAANTNSPLVLVITLLDSRGRRQRLCVCFAPHIFYMKSVCGVFASS